MATWPPATHQDVVDEVNTKRVQLDTVTNTLPTFPHIAHRCATLIYGEETIDGLIDATKIGFPAEVDLRQLVDGTLVCIHDTTVDRTLTNIGTGDVNTKTQAQWRAARVIPAIRGGVTHDAIFWEEVADQFAGRVILVPELKAVDTTVVTAFFANIKKRGLQKSVIVQSFDYTVCQQAAAEGCHAMFLSVNVPTQTAAQVVADGIKFASWSISGNATAGDVTTWKNAGIKMICYTAQTLAHMTTVTTLGYQGVFSDDPWLTSNNIQLQSGLNVARGIRPAGSRYYRYSVASTGSVAGTIAAPTEDVGINGESFGIATTTNTTDTYFYLPNFGVITRPCRISMRIQFAQPSATLTHAAGFVLSNVGTAGFFEDAAHTIPAAQNAIKCVVRRNGQLQAWTYTAGAAPVSLTAVPATAAAGINVVGPTTNEGYVEFTALMTATTVQLFAQSPAYTSTSGTAATTPAANGFFNTTAVANTFNPSGMELTLCFPPSACFISDVRYYPATA